MSTQAVAPWYRHRWPWILMSGPAVVVVAGISTAVIAVKTSDGVVADDYYKQGLAINRVLARDSRAVSLGIGATLAFNEERSAVRVTLASATQSPDALRMTLVHPTREGMDQAATLAQVAPGLYEGPLKLPYSTTWIVSLEDRAATWRVAGRWKASQPRLTLGVAN